MAKQDKPAASSSPAAAAKSDSQSITPRAQNYSEWYLDIIRQAELAEHSAVRGNIWTFFPQRPALGCGHRRIAPREHPS